MSVSYAPPTARLTDFHEKPMQDPVIVTIPHVGGPILVNPKNIAGLPVSNKAIINGGALVTKHGLLLRFDPRMSNNPLPVIATIQPHLNSPIKQLVEIHPTPPGALVKPFQLK